MSNYSGFLIGSYLYDQVKDKCIDNDINKLFLCFIPSYGAPVQLLIAEDVKMW